MALRDVFCSICQTCGHGGDGNILTEDHLQDGETETNSQINHNRAAFLGLGDCHRLDASNVVEAAVDAEGSSGNGDGGTNDEFGG